MKKLIFVLSLFFLGLFLNAQEIKPLYKLPEKTAVNAEEVESGTNVFLVGSDEGLFRITNRNAAIPLWTEGRVDQIVPVNFNDSANSLRSGWFIRTSKGIFFSYDLKNFEERDDGLTFLTIKKYKNKSTSLVKEIQKLKDLCVNPINNKEIVTATKDAVFYSQDAGRSWKNLKSMSLRTPGVKAVAVATINAETVVFMSHPILGLSYIYPNREKPVWIDVDEGFEKMPQTSSSADEISDIIPIIRTRADGSTFTEIYLSQTYMPRIYKFNWEEQKGELIYAGTEPADVIDGLSLIDNVLLYTRLEGFGSLDLSTLQSPGTPSQEEDWHKAFSAVPGMVNTAWIPNYRSGFSKGIVLNELWMLYPGTINTPYAEIANGRKAIYASAYQSRNKEGQDKFKNIILSRNMNAVVIDMKDDYGYLRYHTEDPLVQEKGKESDYAIKDLNAFIDDYKKNGIYMIARIVTFKDKVLSRYAGGKYAVWDGKTNRAWMGEKGMEDVLDEEGNPTGQQKMAYYDEYWVDPFSEEVWEYNITIAKELISRGFDEIQFDYIRFPTDGKNLYNARYRWQNKGMDKESALISFLSYARENINAPIGIDIYGANGWNRSGTRTGQDAEMLSEYVDVIGPMFYPSHFEQTFVNYAPVADRTYRIYYYGSFRNTVLCRNRAIVRPWVQSFFLNVSYDRLYYDSDYIKKQFFGVRDSVDHGYMCWNNVGNYDTTPADVTSDEEFIGTAPEASLKFRKPAIGNLVRPAFVDTDVSVLDSILNPTYLEELDKRNTKKFTPFLQVIP